MKVIEGQQRLENHHNNIWTNQERIEVLFFVTIGNELLLGGIVAGVTPPPLQMTLPSISVH